MNPFLVWICEGCKEIHRGSPYENFHYDCEKSVESTDFPAWRRAVLIVVEDFD